MSLAGKFRRVINLVRYYSNVTDRYFDWFYNRRFRPGFSLADKKRVIDRQFRETAGYDMDWDNPRTFNQKLQWLKLFNEDPLITKCAGKDTAKVYVAERLGAEYVVPNIGVYDSVDDIPFESLPDAFVLKVNWGSGQNIIVRDKCAADISGIKRKLSTWMRPESNHYWFSFEFSYRDVVPKIVCEPYLGELDANLTVYKVFNFKGEPYLIQTIYDDRTEKETINYYDLRWNRLAFRQNFPNNMHDFPKPERLDEMIVCARKLAEPFPYFVRTDFYVVNEKVLFSEFTFYSDNGMAPFLPKHWDRLLGDKIELPTNLAVVNGSGMKK